MERNKPIDDADLYCFSLYNSSQTILLCISISVVDSADNLERICLRNFCFSFRTSLDGDGGRDCDCGFEFELAFELSFELTFGLEYDKEDEEEAENMEEAEEEDDMVTDKV
jgi:hypothetical protein